MKQSLSIVLATLPLLAIAADSHNLLNRADHAGIAHKMRMAAPEPEAEPETHTLRKRFGPARMTYYQTGMGACGIWNNPGDFIVAVNSAQFGGYAVYPPAICGKSITIEYNGKQVGATVQDECPTCSYGELDLSEGLFTQFASTGDGIFQGNWWFNDGSAQPPPAQETTTQQQQQPTPETTSQPPPQTTSSTTSTSETSTTSSTSSTESSSAEPSESSSVDPGLQIQDSTGANNLKQYTRAIASLAGLIQQAAHQST